MKKNIRFGKMVRRISVAMALFVTAGSSQWVLGETEKTAEEIVEEAITEETSEEEIFEEGISKEVSEETQSQAFAQASAQLSINLMKQLLNGEENRLISGESIAEALTIMAAGAQGDTKTELEQTIMGGMDTDTYRELLAEFHQKLSEDSWCTFASADGIWLNEDQGISLLDDFVLQNEEKFDASIQAAPFNENTLQEINAWVSEHTDGMIPHMLGELSEDEMIHILNATVFEGEWMEAFEEAQEETFTSASGEEQTAEMMSSTVGEYLEFSNGVGFLKEYAGGQFAFVGILPEEGISLAEFLQDFTGEDFLQAYENAKSDRVVEIKVPKFSLEDTMSLKETLEAMGVETAFTSEADFSLMTETPLAIDDILHKTYIEVNEQDTRAAAATDVVAKALAVWEPDPEEILEINLDRPFFYGIIDTENGIPLFFGAQNTMTAE